MIQAPKYDEISVKNLYPIFIKLPNMVDYFPDQYSKGRQCDHSYMFNVTNTLHPEIVKETIEHAQSKRYNINKDKQQQEAVLMTEAWAEEL